MTTETKLLTFMIDHESFANEDLYDAQTGWKFTGVTNLASLLTEDSIELNELKITQEEDHTATILNMITGEKEDICIYTDVFFYFKSLIETFACMDGFGCSYGVFQNPDMSEDFSTEATNVIGAYAMIPHSLDRYGLCDVKFRRSHDPAEICDKIPANRLDETILDFSEGAENCLYAVNNHVMKISANHRVYLNTNLKTLERIILNKAKNPTACEIECVGIVFCLAQINAMEIQNYI